MNIPPPEKFFSGSQLMLAQAIARGDLPEVKALAVKTDLNRSMAPDMTLLHFALLNARGEKPVQLLILTELVKAGADPRYEITERTAGDVYVGSVLGLALRAESPLYVKALLDGGLSPDATVNHRSSIPSIFRAASEKTFDTLKLLIERGANVNKRDALGNTALNEALSGLYLDQVVYLLDHRANPNVINVNGVSFAWQVAGRIQRQQEGSPAQRKLIEIRDRIVQRGVKWPPDSPDIERARMKARGEVPGQPFKEN